MNDPQTMKEMLLDEKWLSTPDMGEYLDSSMIQKAAEELSKGEVSDGEFYIETPFATAPGYYPTENVIIISGKPTFQQDSEKGNTGVNKSDGDTVYIKYDKIIDNGAIVQVNSTDEPLTIVETLRRTSAKIENSDDTLGIRLLGIDAPELPHFRYFNYSSKVNLVTTTYGQLMAAKFGEDYVTMSNGAQVQKKNIQFVKYNPMTDEPTPRNNNEVLAFIASESKEADVIDGSMDVKYFEVLNTPTVNAHPAEGTIRICTSHNVEDNTEMDYFKQALGAQYDLMRLINESKNTIYMLDQSYFAAKAQGLIPWDYKKEYDKISAYPFYAFESLWKNLTKAGEAAYQQMGKRYFGQETNGRYLGAIFCLTTTEYGDQWINVAKYLINKYPLVINLPSFTYSGATESEYQNVADVFKSWTYDKTKQSYLDAINTVGVDDRYEVQKQITGIDLSELTNHTVMIGDCLLMIPPTSIRTVTQTRSERISMLRSKGGLTKTLPKTERIIEMQVYFNGEQAINGIPYNQETPSGLNMTYHMNGLRSLISQFKFTPFLPIHNDYINYVLNIEAVSLCSIQVSTVPNFPRTLQATIKLQEFDYRQYMPEILPPDAENREDLYTNLFSKVIHWPVFRYYYQKAIQNGEVISDYEFNSEDYIYETVGQKTALQNMKFVNPTFDLYVASEEVLKQRKSVKQSLERRPIESVITFNTKEEALIKYLVEVYESVRTAMSSNSNLIEKGLFKPKDKDVEVLFNRYINREKTFYTEEDFHLEDGIGIYYGKKIDDYLTEGYNMYEITTSRRDLYDLYIKKLSNKLIEAVKNTSLNNTINIDQYDLYIKGCNFVYKQIGIDSTWEDGGSFETEFRFGLELTIDWAQTGYTETLDKLKRLIAKELKVEKTDIFADDKIFIGWTSFFMRGDKISDGRGLEFQSGPQVYLGTDYKTMAYLMSSFGGIVEDASKDDTTTDMWTAQEEIGNIKDDIDLETSDSMKFDLYDIGDPIINNISMSYNNIFNYMSMKIYDGYASQFTGGTDVSIEIDMTATNEYTVNQLQLISRICAQRLIDYRKVIASSPLRIDSEMTRFMGVNEIIIESVDISTIPNFPGTWNVNMKLTSVDRTLRNREALKKVDKITNVTTSYDPTVKTKNFFDVKNALAKVELYPDLELPTIPELEKLGFYYIKYKSEGARLFPDADFYFAYLHVFSSEMIKETIVNFFKDSNNNTLYHEYAGDLFNNDKAIVKWDLNKDNKEFSDEELATMKSSGYSIKSNQQCDILKAVMTETGSEEYLSSVEKANKTASSNVTETTSEKDAKNAIARRDGVNNGLLLLNEALDTTSFYSTDLNPDYKFSIQGSIPYNQETNLLSGERTVRRYKTNEKTGDLMVIDSVFKYEEITTEDRVAYCTDDLKSLIISILKKPIDTGNDFKDDINNFMTYLTKDIVGLNQFYDTAKLFDILEAFARGYSAKLGLYDVEAIFKNEKKDENAVARNKIKKLEYIERNIDGDIHTIPVEKEYDYVMFSKPGQSSMLALATTEEEKDQGIIFGKFGIKKYDSQMISKIFEIELVDSKSGFLDPYYNAQLSKFILGEEIDQDTEDARIKSYISLVLSEENKHCEMAFFRNMLVWLYKFLSDERHSLLPDSLFLMGDMKEYLKTAKKSDDNIFENIAHYFHREGLLLFNGVADDVNDLTDKKKESTAFSSEQQAELDAKTIELDAMNSEKQLEDDLEDMIKDLFDGLPKLRLSLINGLFVTLGILALTEFSTPVYSSVVSGDIGTYSSYVEKIKSLYTSAQDVTGSDLQIRKVFQYLDWPFNSRSKYDEINDISILDKYSYQASTQRLYLEAAETPSTYLMHSFYDMVMNDMRGRMARAFPTYYMLLIDEGRDLGIWRLQDNFYDVSSITEFQVVKSRKIAADTAKISMTNLFGTFTTEDDDMKDEYQYTFRDMFNSVFSPRPYVAKEYQRYSEARSINRAKIRPGARVNLRLGYSADASRLPILFNGTVAEIQQGDLMTIVCQGDGIELANPAMFNATDSKDVADLEYNDSLISGFLGVFADETTPRDILLNPLIAEGSFIHTLVKNWSKGRLFNSNPFGITHFGDRRFKTIFANNGEVEQNIYEASSRPSWGKSFPATNSNAYSYALTTPPKIKVGLQGGKSYWDLMHIATSVSTDYVSAVVPFQMRSSVFYGAPRYYCAYDYDLLPNAQLVEKRKPFQQYHIYTSYTDILSNGITASDKEIKTCAVGIYQAPGVFVGHSSKSIGPLYLDIDIYPENQKMTTINCNFEYINLDLLPFTIPIFDKLMDELSETGGYQIAWRATANGLRETVKDMYTGELIVIGDPTVKPYDKIFINDLYEDIQGMVDVESVVHTFNVDTGFTTSITPDCISAVDNKYEQVASSTVRNMLTPFIVQHAALCTSSLIFANFARPMFFAAEHAVGLGANITKKATDSITKVLGADNLAINSRFTNAITKKLGYAFGVTPTDLSIYKSVSKIDDAYKALNITHTMESSKDAVNMIDNLLGLDTTLSDLNPKNLYTELDSVSSLTDSTSKTKVLNAKKSAEELVKTYDASSKSIINNVKIVPEDLDKILKATDFDKIANPSDELKKARKILQEARASGNGIKCVDNIASMEKELNALKTTMRSIENFTDEADDIVKIFTRLDTDVFKGATRSFKSFDNVVDTFKAVNSIKKGAGVLKAFISSSIVGFIAEIAISKGVQEYIERTMKNWQVLTVFPLLKNGLVMTAGLNGSKGSVFGSPTYSQAGWLEDMAIKFFDYKGSNAVGAVGAFLRDVFITSEDMLKTVNSFKRDNGYGAEVGSTEVKAQANIYELMQQVAKQTASGMNAYRELYFDARVESSKSKEGKEALAYYQLIDMTEDALIHTKTISNNLVPINIDGDLVSRLMDKGVFSFVGANSINESTDTADYSSENYIIIQNTEGTPQVTCPCKTITKKSSDGSREEYTVYVLPYLRPDAYTALQWIVEQICKEIQPDYKSETCRFEYMHQHNIILHNGVMINEKNWMSTGFAFVLEVKNYDNFSNIIEKIKTEDEANSEGRGYKILEIQQDAKLGSHAYDFFVSPKKV